MKKSTQLWTILFAFLFGQLIQLVTVALAHYMYISDPVAVCITVGILTVAVVVLSSIITLMGSEQIGAQHTVKTKPRNVVLPISFDKRPPLDTDPEDIDKIDKNLAKESR